MLRSIDKSVATELQQIGRAPSLEEGWERTEFLHFLCSNPHLDSQKVQGDWIGGRQHLHSANHVV